MFDMDTLDWRKLVIDILSGSVKEEEALNIIDAHKCVCCGEINIDEFMYENEDGHYCETCWISKE